MTRREIIREIRARLRALGVHLRALERWKRRPPARWTEVFVAPDPACAGATPDDATLLCAVQAHLRGRLHMKRWRWNQEGRRTEIADLAAQEAWIRTQLAEAMRRAKIAHLFSTPYVGADLVAAILAALDGEMKEGTPEETGQRAV